MNNLDLSEEEYNRIINEGNRITKALNKEIKNGEASYIEIDYDYFKSLLDESKIST